MFMFFDWNRLDAEDYEYTSNNVAACAKAFLFMAFLIGTASFIGSAMLLSNRWQNKVVLYGVGQLIACLFITIRYQICIFIFDFNVIYCMQRFVCFFTYTVE